MRQVPNQSENLPSTLRFLRQFSELLVEESDQGTWLFGGQIYANH